MSFKIIFGNQSSKFLRKQDKLIAERIFNKIENVFIITPVPSNSKRVEGMDELVFRIRIGDYRVLYEVDYENKEIGIIKIEKRSRVYD